MTWGDEHWTGTYILDEDGNPVPVDSMTWATWFERSNRRLALTDLGIYRISTVFLGLDHSFSPINDPLTYKPVLWETMCFDFSGDWHGHEMEHYTSRADALAGHEAMVRRYQELMASEAADTESVAGPGEEKSE
jgi:hypothetical protein